MADALHASSPAPADRKQRFAGLLENPWVSMIQRNILDAGRWRGLSRTLQPLALKSVLDVGCGLGENSCSCPAGYVGADNSPSRLVFAQNQHKQSRFILADARCLPVKPKTFDLVMLIDTSHHLTDDQFASVLEQMAQASRRWVLVSDPVLHEGQSAASRFFYSLDRGAMFRDAARLTEIARGCQRLVLEKVEHFVTFPGLYRHGVFLLRVRS